MQSKVLIEPISFVDKTELIEPISFVSKLDPEERKYLILYFGTDPDNGDEIKSFEIITGRTATYEFIKNMIDSIDIHESKVMTTHDMTYDEAGSVYLFMKAMQQFFVDGFDIADYCTGDMEEENN